MFFVLLKEGDAHGMQVEVFLLTTLLQVIFFCSLFTGPTEVSANNLSDVSLIENETRVVSTNLAAPHFIDYGKIVNKSQEEASLIIKNALNHNQTEGEQGYVESIRFDVDDFTLGTYEGTAHFVTVDGQEDKNISIVIYGGTLMEKDMSFSPTQLEQNPSLIIDSLEMSQKEQAANVKVSWVDKYGEPYKFQDYLDGMTIGQELFIKIEEKDSPFLMSMIPVTESYLLRHLDLKRAMESDIEVVSNPPLLLKSELMLTKNSEEVGRLIHETLSPSFIDKTTGEELKNVSFEPPKGWESSTSSGTEGVMTYTIKQAGQKDIRKIMNVTVMPDGIISDVSDWEEIPLGSNEGVIVNPVNHSKIGFNQRGMKSNVKTEFGFVINDKLGRNYVHNNLQASFIPYSNSDNILYWQSGSAGNGMSNYGFGGAPNSNMTITSSYFLKHKETGALKQIITEAKRHYIYVFDLFLRNNLNFDITFTAYNTRNQEQVLAIVEYADTDYIDDNVSLETYSKKIRKRPSNKIETVDEILGFAMSPNDEDRMSFILKNNQGHWLTDYRKMAPGVLQIAPNNQIMAQFPYASWNLGGIEPVFGRGLIQPGIERFNLENKTSITKNLDTAYQLASENKTLKEGESLSVGYQLFLGSDIKLMDLKLEPDELNFYTVDLKEGEDIGIDYVLSGMDAKERLSGPIYASTDGQNVIEIAEFDKPVGETHAEGHLRFPDSMFTRAEESNKDYGNTETYEIMISAVNMESESNYYLLSSDEEILTINTYDLGAEPINQTIKKGTKWTKKPEDLLTNKRFVPGNDVVFEYVDDQTIQTDVLGLQSIDVKMKDKTSDSERIYTVFVNVIDGNLPNDGVTLVANGFELQGRGEIAHKTNEEKYQMIIDKSNAVAWDNSTGLSRGLDIYMMYTGLNDGITPGPYNEHIYVKRTGSSIQITSAVVKVLLLPDIDAEINNEAIPQDITLGQRVTDEYDETELRSWVKNVVFDGQHTTEFDISIKEMDTQHISDGSQVNGLMRVSRKVTGLPEISGKIAYKDIPINFKVGWGETLAIGGSLVDLGDPSKESALALTLHDRHNSQKGLYLTTSYGNHVQYHLNIPFDSNIHGAPFMQLSHYPISGQQISVDNALELEKGPHLLEETTLDVLGENYPKEIVTKLSGNNALEVSYGDVLHVYMHHSENIAFYSENNGPTFLPEGLPNSNDLYFVVTTRGLEPLYLTHLLSKEVAIPTEDTVSQSDYDNHLSDYFTLDGEGSYLSIPEGIPSNLYRDIEVFGFEEYPKLKLAVGETSSGKISVSQETLQGGVHYVLAPYDILFTGTGPNIYFKNVPEKMSFETVYIKSITQIIKQNTNGEKWGFDILDARMRRHGWNIQAKFKPFRTGEEEGQVELKGASLGVGTGEDSIHLTNEFQVIYHKETPISGMNEVQWEEGDGFFLEIPPSSVKKEQLYTSHVDFILTNTPDE